MRDGDRGEGEGKASDTGEAIDRKIANARKEFKLTSCRGQKVAYLAVLAMAVFMSLTPTGYYAERFISQVWSLSSACESKVMTALRGPSAATDSGSVAYVAKVANHESRAQVMAATTRSEEAHDLGRMALISFVMLVVLSTDFKLYDLIKDLIKAIASRRDNKDGER
jgi:hypothetical protein